MLCAACGRKESTVQVDCNIDEGPCLKTIASDAPIEISLDINPKPVVTMKRLMFSVKATQKGSAVTGANAAIELSMPGIYMMENRIQLRQTAPGTGV
jgi:hypothetical protein